MGDNGRRPEEMERNCGKGDDQPKTKLEIHFISLILCVTLGINYCRPIHACTDFYGMNINTTPIG